MGIELLFEFDVLILIKFPTFLFEPLSADYLVCINYNPYLKSESSAFLKCLARSLSLSSDLSKSNPSIANTSFSSCGIGGMWYGLLPTTMWLQENGQEIHELTTQQEHKEFEELTN